MTIDIGDHVDRFHSISEATNGLGNTKLLNEALYDYVTIGNNEGITLAKEHLNRLYDDAGFEVLVANLFEKEGVRPSWAKPYKLHTTTDGWDYDCFYRVNCCVSRVLSNARLAY